MGPQQSSDTDVKNFDINKYQGDIDSYTSIRDNIQELGNEERSTNIQARIIIKNELKWPLEFYGQHCYEGYYFFDPHRVFPIQPAGLSAVLTTKSYDAVYGSKGSLTVKVVTRNERAELQIWIVRLGFYLAHDPSLNNRCGIEINPVEPTKLPNTAQSSDDPFIKEHCHTGKRYEYRKHHNEASGMYKVVCEYQNSGLSDYIYTFAPM